MNTKPNKPKTLKIIIGNGKAMPEKREINGMFFIKFGIDNAKLSFQSANESIDGIKGYAIKPKNSSRS
ncbi:hypothetical protein [Providencia stuartii]|uniref:hypothetical protein n=1 Tax=Providencia stuartii TaxID=588 RepID=UPI0040682A52